MNNGAKQWVSRSPESTVRLGQRIGEGLKGDVLILLKGAVGSGKTTFTKGLAKGMGMRASTSHVVSPSFVLIREYECKVPLRHIDLYRLEKLGDEEKREVEESLSKTGVTVIEWAERFPELRHIPHLEVDFSHKGGDDRLIKIIPRFRQGTASI